MKLCRFAEELNLRAPLQVNYCKIIALLQKGKRLWQKLPNISFWNTISPHPFSLFGKLLPGVSFLYFLQHLLLLLIKFLTMIKLRKNLQKLNNVLSSSSNLHYKNTKRKQHLYYFPHICLKQAFWRWCSPCHKLNFTLFRNSNSLFW